MNKGILSVSIALLLSAFLSSAIIVNRNSIVLAQNETVDKSISSKLALTIIAYDISRDESGKAISPSIKFWVRNISDETVTFPFEKGMIWYWEKSIDGQPFEAMGAGDWDPALLQERVTLKPNEMVKGCITGSAYLRGPVSKIQLRYNRPPYYMLVSNELNLSTEKWGDKTHTNDPDWVNEKLTLSIRRNNNGLEAVIRNVSLENISFYFETCPICFWSISINGGEWQSLLKAEHDHPCFLHNILALMPGKNITYNLQGYYNLDGVRTLKLRYRYGDYDEKHLVLESDIFKIQ